MSKNLVLPVSSQGRRPRMAGVFYRIRDWDTHFETHKTRPIKSMTHVLVPNRMDGSAYIALMKHPNGPAHFGAWIALLEIASLCIPRGDLIRANGIPYTTDI